MGLLLRGCFSCQQKLFKQEIISLKRIVAHSVYNNNVKKFTSTLQVMRFYSQKEKDNDKELIYNGSLSKKIRRLKIFCLCTSVVSFTAQPVLYNKLMMEDNIGQIVIIFMLFNFICACNPMLVHYMSKGYIVNMYHNLKEGNYIATVYTLFAKKKEIVFAATDVQLSEDNRTLTNCTVKGIPLIFDENSFLDRKYYYIIMKDKESERALVEELTVPSINAPQVTHQNHQIEKKRVIEE